MRLRRRGIKLRYELIGDALHPDLGLACAAEVRVRNGYWNHFFIVAQSEGSWASWTPCASFTSALT